MTAAPWHLDLERSGGFAGLTLRSRLATDELPPPEAADLARLASAVDFSRYPPASSVAEPGLPDAFQYHLVAEHGPDRHELRLGESELDPNLKTLVEWLLEHQPENP